MHLPDFDITKLLDWGFLGLAARYASKISTSIDRLNLRVARLLERTEHHERALDNHESRIGHMERRGD